jgi:hypothetical protein
LLEEKFQVHVCRVFGQPVNRIRQKNVHRREVLLGFVAGAVGAPLAGAPSAAAERTEPPGDGPLSVKEVGSILGQHNVPGASLAIIQNGEIVATYTLTVANQPPSSLAPPTAGPRNQGLRDYVQF